jgi:hypothetical protein
MRSRDTAPLQAARAGEISMAAADDDPSVCAVAEGGEGREGGEGGAGARSASPTPLLATQAAPRLADTVAALRANGDNPV